MLDSELEFQHKILSWNALSEEEDSKMKQINAERNFWIRFDNLPGFLHFFTPMNVIKNEY